MRTGTFTVPLFIRLGTKKKKNHWLNMNSYRNWVHHLSNSLKIAFKKEANLQWIGEPLSKCRVKFRFYYPTKTGRDIDGSLSVISKFTLDAMVDAGVIVDDNHKVVVKICGEFAGYDKDNPRCEVFIEEIE